MKTSTLSRLFISGIFCTAVAFRLLAQYDTDPSQKSTSPEFQWPEGKRTAVSLTFDDARLSQVDKGIPVLDKYQVKATFYISPGNFLERIDGWKSAVKNGHEIGNHSIHHPCSGNFAWSREHALETYTLNNIYEELDSANLFIKEHLGILPVSFAYPCGQTYIGRGMATTSYIPLVASMFSSGRGWLGESSNDPLYCDLAQLSGTELDGRSFEEILKIIASSEGRWIVLAGHETDYGGYQTSLLSTIEELCRYASDPANGIWLENVGTIASYVKMHRKEP